MSLASRSEVPISPTVEAMQAKFHANLASPRGSSTPVVAVCFHRLGPYHATRLAAAAELLNVTAVEFSGTTDAYAWDAVGLDRRVRRVTVRPESDLRALPSSARSSAIRAALDDVKPDVVAINGWSDSGALHALVWCVRNAVPAIVMSETRRRDAPRRVGLEWAKRRVVSCFASALAGGESHAQYLTELGMPPSRCSLGYDVVDNRHFQPRPNRSAGVVRVHGAPLPEKYFLASCRFIPRKNLPRVIQAFAAYRRRAGPAAWDLVILGDGPQRLELAQWCSELHVAEHVHMPGFKQYDELPVYYAAANVFVHASTVEPWGLVVNEAMAAGLPVLVSRHCGCAAELVSDGANGYVFDPLNVEELARRMNQLAHGGADLEAMGRASQQIVSAWGPERFARGLAEAVDRALHTAARTSRWWDRLVVNLLARR